MNGDNEEGQEETRPSRFGATQWYLVALSVGVALAAELYRVAEHRGLGQSGAIFIGIPTVLAVAVALTPKTKTVMGGIMKAITLMLLIVAPLLGEGWFCILIASPLFYAVGLLIGLVVKWSERWKRRGKGATVSCVAMVLLPMSLEGVVPELTFGREQTVEVSRVVQAPCAQVEQALAESPRIGVRLPLLLRIGFPVPVEARGVELEVGATRTVRFSGVEGAPAGDLVMRVTARRPGFARTEAVSDGSKLAHWMRWESSEVAWRAVDATHTEVTWRIEFTRELDPAWYFVPLERAAVHEAAEFMIESNATPVGVAR